MAKSQPADPKIMAQIIMYSTAVCPYCIRAEQLLQRKGVTVIDKIRIDLEPDLRIAMMEKTGRRTVPQIFINEQHIGGYDDLAALDQAGLLNALLAN